MFTTITEIVLKKDISLEARLVLIYMMYLESKVNQIIFSRSDFSGLNISEKAVRSALRELEKVHLIEVARTKHPGESAGRPLDIFSLLNDRSSEGFCLQVLEERQSDIDALIRRGIVVDMTGAEEKITRPIDYLILVMFYAKINLGGEAMLHNLSRSLGVTASRLARRVKALIATGVIRGVKIGRDYYLGADVKEIAPTTEFRLALEPSLDPFKTLMRYIDFIGQDKQLLTAYRPRFDWTLITLMSRHYVSVVDRDKIKSLFGSCKSVGFRVTSAVREGFFRQVGVIRGSIGTTDGKSWTDELNKVRSAWCVARRKAVDGLVLVEMIAANLVIDFIDQIRGVFEDFPDMRFSSMISGGRRPVFIIRHVEDIKN